MKGSEAIVSTLVDKGFDVTFGFPGGTVIPLFDAFLDNDKIRNILVRHEQAAAHAADAYARVLGKPGICIATSGPGATNLVTGIMNAYMDSSPILAFGGQVSTNLIGNDAFQESDMIGITMPITKHSFQPRNADEIIPAILKGLRIATEGRPGPVYIDLPKDVQCQEVKNLNRNVKIAGFQPNLHGNPVQIRKAAEAINNSERPLFLAGGGVSLSNASAELGRLVNMVKAPIATTLMGKGIFPEDHPLCLGMVGMHGRRIANYAVLKCDLLIAIGCRFSDRITGELSSFAENAKVIHIDVDPAEIGKNVKVDIPIVGDARLVISDLINVLSKTGAKSPSAWGKRIKELAEMCKCNLDYDTTPISPRRLIKDLRGIIKDDIVCTGVGQHQMYAAHYLRIRKPRHFITSGGAGTMGFGLPAAIGAKTAKPECEVYNLDGDGSFAMTQQELGTIKEENIKVITAIFNNEYLGMVRQWLDIFFDKRYSQVHLKKTPDFAKLAEAYSLNGYSVDKPGDIIPTLKEAKKNKEASVLDIHIDPSENILPMLPPGGHLRDAFGGCMNSKGEFF
ncbi:MAG: biosynthetic-type acetolactate synthase large subunit [archaeon]